MNIPVRASVRQAGRSVFIAPCILAWLGVIGGVAVNAQTPADDEVRALWVLRTSLTSPQAIEAMVRAARDNGFNTLLVQVRSRGDAYFNGGLEPRASRLALQPPSFDPLHAVLTSAHELELNVHAWINVNLVASASDLPSSRSHVIYRHPEWLMVPREIASEMAEVEPQSPAYIGKLARWTRAHSDEVEGLYLSPLLADAAAYTTDVIADLAERYPLDGVHLDYVRYPSDAFDYSQSAMAALRTEVAPRLAATERMQRDARAVVTPTTYADRFPDAWDAVRRSRLTSLVMRIHTAVKRRLPAATISAAVVPDAQDATQHHFQDWRTWLDSSLLDVAIPMAYTQDAGVFADQITSARRIAGLQGLWAGIGAYRLSPDQTIDNIITARRLNADGIALFSYDSLTDPAQHQIDYLPQVAHGAFGGARPAATGSR